MSERFDTVFAGRVSSHVPNEGLIVLLCDLMRNLVALGIRVVIHTTDRHAPSLRRALALNGLDPDAIEVRVYAVGSVGLHRRGQPAAKRQPRESVAGRVLRQVVGGAERAVSGLVRTAIFWRLNLGIGNRLAQALAGLALALLLVVLAVPASLAGVLAVVFLAALVLARRLPRIVRRLMRSRLYPHEMRSLTQRLRKRLRHTRQDIDDQLLRDEQLRLAQQLNRNRDVGVYFLFSAFEGELVRALEQPAVMVFPDAVPLHFPTRFADAVGAETLRQIGLAVEHASGIVCYSKFVRDHQLRRLYPAQIEGKPIAVIPQGYFALRPAEERCGRQGAAQRLNRERHRLANVFPELLRGAPHAQFGQFEYVLYPTIDRQHKNTLTLVRACARLLRVQHRNVKLVLTTPHAMPDVHEFILRERLHYDVLFMPSVPGDVLDDLCAAAAVVAHPSLAEGGDVFNFSRAVANGTPALLADIPVVREMFERAGFDAASYEASLFDPFDERALAQRIGQIIDQREALLAQQQRLLAQLSTYGYREMAQRYLDFMRKVGDGQAHSRL